MQKAYATLLALSKDERETELKTAADRGIVLQSEKTLLQKVAAKTLCAMKSAGEITGKINAHAMKITGHDIRDTLQNVYELVNVFSAIQAGEIELTEADFDKLDTSKLALLSPFLTKPELKEKLGEAVEAAKTGTAKDIRALKPGKEKSEKSEDEKPEGTKIPVGFVATDIKADEALANSRQFKDRVKADLIRAMDAGDADTLDEIKEVFGRVFLAACAALGEDALDFVAEVASEKAKPAAGQTVETQALAAA